MKNKLLKILTFVVSGVMLVGTFTLFGCKDGKETGDLSLVKSDVLGYFEDFGNEVITRSVLNDGLNREEHGNVEANYHGLEVDLGRKIFLSHLKIPKGKYTAKVGDKSLGNITINASGEAELTSVPKDLVLGEYYTLTCTTAHGKPYEQPIRYVSRTIDTDVEYMRMITYYTRFHYKDIYDCGDYDVDTTAPCEHTNVKKYYNGETFSQRFYVLADDIFLGRGTKWVGAEGIYWPDGFAQVDLDPYCNLDKGKYYYFYDVLDGQGHNVNIQEMNNHGLFGQIATGAKIYDLSFDLSMLHDYASWDMDVSPKTRSFIAYSIANGATVQSVAVYTSIASGVVNGVNGIAPIIRAGANVSDIYIGLFDKMTYDYRSDEDMYYSGILGHSCELEAINNVVAISPLMDFAYYLNGDKYMAENDSGDYLVQGLFRFRSAEEAINSGFGKVGNWAINENGTVNFVKN